MINREICVVFDVIQPQLSRPSSSYLPIKCACDCSVVVLLCLQMWTYHKSFVMFILWKTVRWDLHVIDPHVVACPVLFVYDLQYALNALHSKHLQGSTFLHSQPYAITANTKPLNSFILFAVEIILLSISP